MLSARRHSVPTTAHQVSQQVDRGTGPLHAREQSGPGGQGGWRASESDRLARCRTEHGVGCCPRASSTQPSTASLTRDPPLGRVRARTHGEGPRQLGGKPPGAPHSPNPGRSARTPLQRAQTPRCRRLIVPIAPALTRGKGMPNASNAQQRRAFVPRSAAVTDECEQHAYCVAEREDGAYSRRSFSCALRTVRASRGS